MTKLYQNMQAKEDSHEHQTIQLPLPNSDFRETNGNKNMTVRLRVWVVEMS